MTYLAVPITVEHSYQVTAAVDQAIAQGAELIELRLDYLTDIASDVVQRIVTDVKKFDIPVLATCRSAAEGGKFSGAEADRLSLLADAGAAGADLIDVEAVAKNAEGVRKAAPSVIISNHNFTSLPSDLAQRWANIAEKKPNVGKIVYTAKRITDSFAALDILRAEQEAGRDAIALAMGEQGVITRLLAKKLGAFLTFASVSQGAESAPGQVTVDDMKNLYRWDHIGADTEVFGVIGSPVGHSMSPAIHNAAFSATGYDGLYLPLLIEPTWEEFTAFMDGVRRRRWLDVRGLSVTIPHKSHALDYVKQAGGQLEPLAEKIGAVNTICLDANGAVSGYNTDYAGSLDAITGALGIDRTDLKGVPAVVIGAGGVARALVAGLTDAGAKVSIYNRTVERGVKLAREFGCTAGPLSDLASLDAKLLVNCTSVGMHPKVDASPVPAELLKSDMTVFDTVYTPMQTLLLGQAQAAGAKTIDGVSMFVNQAAAQFALFTQQDPPRQAMREQVVTRLTRNH